MTAVLLLVAASFAGRRSNCVTPTPAAAVVHGGLTGGVEIAR
ncbi:MAG TPA: hypothetical protein VHB97_16970 [Polyangia bacterium]|nr:hypothetical protein [Polyangia bacterium]